MKQILILCTLLASAELWAQAGTRGGQSAVHQGQIRFRDLVDPSACQIMNVSEFSGKYQVQLAPVFTQLEKYDWYLALSLQEEIQRLRFCITSGIRGYIAEYIKRHYHPIVAHPPFKILQSAYRDGDMVYVDRDDLDAWPKSELDHEGLLVHEALHSFLPDTWRDQWEGRYQRLVSLTQIILKIAQGEPISIEQWEMTRSYSGIRLTDSALLNNYKDVIEYAKANNSSRDAVLSTISDEDIEEFLLSMESVPDPVKIPRLFESEIERACLQRSPPLVKKLIFNSEIKSINPVEYCLGLEQTWTDKVWVEELLKTDSSGPSSTLSFLKTKAISFEKGRLRVNTALAAFGIFENPSSDKFTELRPILRESWPQQNWRVRQFWGSLVRMAQAHYWDLVQSRIDDSFYEAFSLASIKEQLETLPEVSKLEREVALLNVAVLQKHYAKSLQHYIRTNLNQADSKQLLQMIDWKRFERGTK